MSVQHSLFLVDLDEPRLADCDLSLPHGICNRRNRTRDLQNCDAVKTLHSRHSLIREQGIFEHVSDDIGVAHAVRPHFRNRKRFVDFFLVAHGCCCPTLPKVRRHQTTRADFLTLNFRDLAKIRRGVAACSTLEQISLIAREFTDARTAVVPILNSNLLFKSALASAMTADSATDLRLSDPADAVAGQFCSLLEKLAERFVSSLGQLFISARKLAIVGMNLDHGSAFPAAVKRMAPKPSEMLAGFRRAVRAGHRDRDVGGWVFHGQRIPA